MIGRKAKTVIIQWCFTQQKSSHGSKPCEKLSFRKTYPHITLMRFCQWDLIVLNLIFNNSHYFISFFFSWGEEWEDLRKIVQKAIYLEPMETKRRSAAAPQYFALSQGSQESDWNFIFGVTNFWLVRFLQPVIISNVSVGLHRYLKTLTRVMYNFPIFPAPSVLNCIGRWIFGIWGCQVSAMEDFMH